MQDIITVNHLSKSYGSHQVLNDISFSFQPGQFLTLRAKVDGFVPYTFDQVKGQPFVVSELVSSFEEIMAK